MSFTHLFSVWLSHATFCLFSHFHLPSVLFSEYSQCCCCMAQYFLCPQPLKKGHFSILNDEMMKKNRRVVEVHRYGLKEWETILKGIVQCQNESVLMIGISQYFKSLSKSPQLDKTQLFLNGSGFWTHLMEKRLPLLLLSLFWWMCYISSNRD